MFDITFVCCYNNYAAFNRLEDALKKQSSIATIIGIDNCSASFRSCSSAYNSVLNSIKTKYVAFIHQDIVFLSNDTVSLIIEYLKKTSEYDLLGVAGAVEEIKFTSKVYSNIIHGKNKTNAGSTFQGMRECMTVDECLIFGHTRFFINNHFDEKTCDNWHLYSVELCLRTKANKGKVYACDIYLYHESKGTLSHKYVQGFYNLCRYYHKTYPFITTCCASSRTAFPFLIKTCFVIEGSIFKRRIIKGRNN